jgi:hypothetical protein
MKKWINITCILIIPTKNKTLVNINFITTTFTIIFITYITGGPIYPQVLKETRVAYQRRNMSKTKVKGIVKVSYFYLYLILIVTKLNL